MISASNSTLYGLSTATSDRAAKAARASAALFAATRTTSCVGPVCFTSATELVRLYRARRVSPLEVVEALLARVDAVNPAVNAIVTLARDAALAEARRATETLGKGHRPGPLHGVPVAIKDVTATRGICRPP